MSGAGRHCEKCRERGWGMIADCVLESVRYDRKWNLCSLCAGKALVSPGTLVPHFDETTFRVSGLVYTHPENIREAMAQ